MMSTTVIFAVFGLWLLLLTLFAYRIRAHYKRLVSRTKKKTLDEILDFLTKKSDDFTRDIDQVKQSIDELRSKGKEHLQKVGFVRFNPFDRVGGEQSFVVAVLDHNDSGIILNFLYTREGVRIYSKEVKEGKGVEYELSKEEKEAIKKAN